MMDIGCKTRKNANPTGKPRVWFCAHPRDYDDFFEHISEQILQKQNCAIYFDQNPAADTGTDALLSDLSTMNLFVMPVTSRLLLEKNRALDVEFRYALAHHIPVLPLMQERGLEELFNTKCGDLQFLDEYARDTTGIPFDVKLERFLSSVLVGDQLAEQVRKAFDAYIFLSYRKKDRKYAQELMHLIHENAFCRDIAIWYDEFLVPGENFNDSILDAMRKSKLFALAVTPNLLEPKNYVMDVEFKKARDEAMPILAAEVVGTDHIQLSELFVGIPDAVDAHNAGALSHALLEHLAGLGKRENDRDPVHNFLIGLAYLSGIDVEINQQRALEMITFSAEAGLPEAMDKLARMYRNGEGVPRDHTLLLHWQQQLTEHRKKAHAEGSISTAEYVSALLALADDYYTFRQTKQALAQYGAVIGVASSEAVPTTACAEAILTAYGKTATLYMECGALSSAYDILNRQKAYIKSLPGDIKGAIPGSLIAASLNMGQLYHTWGILYGAEEQYKEAGQTATRIHRAVNSEKSAFDLLNCYQRLAELFLSCGDMGEALGASEMALELAGELECRAPGNAARRESVLCHLLRGEVLQASENHLEAKEQFCAAEKLAAELSQTGSFDDRRNLMLCRRALGRLYMSMAWGTEARQLLEAARSAAQTLADEVGTSRTLLDLAEVHLSFADMYQSVFLSDPNLAQLFDPALEDTEAVEMDGEALSALWDENNRQATQHCASALEAVKQAGRLSQMPEVQHLLAQCHLRMGQAHQMDGNYTGAREHYQLGVDMQRALCKSMSTPERSYGLYQAYMQMDDFLQSTQSNATENSEDSPPSDALPVKIKQLFCRPKASPYLKKAYRLIRKLKWGYPMMRRYQDGCAETEEKLGIRNGLSFWPVVAALAGILGMGASAYYYNYLGLPADWIYWALNIPVLPGFWGILRICEQKRFDRYRKRVNRKGRKAKMDRFDKLCTDGQFCCMYILITTVLFVLLFTAIR